LDTSAFCTGKGLKIQDTLQICSRHGGCTGFVTNRAIAALLLVCNKQYCIARQQLEDIFKDSPAQEFFTFGFHQQVSVEDIKVVSSGNIQTTEAEC